ncbi:MAG: hypothetical protein QW303_02125 [Nitrososphaerota archaeon]
MKKEEKILREILIGIKEGKETFFQKEISEKCNVSIGLVNKVIKKLELQNSLQRKNKGFSIIDPSKILLYWAIKRQIKKEINEKYYIKSTIETIEKTLPACAIFTAFSAWKLLTGRVPADYREVYIYVPKKEEKMIKLWLKENKIFKGPENLFIIYINDDHLIKNSKKNIAPLPQIFVDLYSIGGISSKYFLKDILETNPEFKFEV